MSEPITLIGGGDQQRTFYRFKLHLTREFAKLSTTHPPNWRVELHSPQPSPRWWKGEFIPLPQTTSAYEEIRLSLVPDLDR